MKWMQEIAVYMYSDVWYEIYRNRFIELSLFIMRMELEAMSTHFCVTPWISTHEFIVFLSIQMEINSIFARDCVCVNGGVHILANRGTVIFHRISSEWIRGGGGGDEINRSLYTIHPWNICMTVWINVLMICVHFILMNRNLCILIDLNLAICYFCACAYMRWRKWGADGQWIIGCYNNLLNHVSYRYFCLFILILCISCFRHYRSCVIISFSAALFIFLLSVVQVNKIHKCSIIICISTDIISIRDYFRGICANP